MFRTIWADSQPRAAQTCFEQREGAPCATGCAERLNELHLYNYDALHQQVLERSAAGAQPLHRDRLSAADAAQQSADYSTEPVHRFEFPEREVRGASNRVARGFERGGLLIRTGVRQQRGHGAERFHGQGGFLRHSRSYRRRPLQRAQHQRLAGGSGSLHAIHLGGEFVYADGGWHSGHRDSFGQYSERSGGRHQLLRRECLGDHRQPGLAVCAGLPAVPAKHQAGQHHHSAQRRNPGSDGHTLRWIGSPIPGQRAIRLPPFPRIRAP